jgi:spermidine synthase
VWTRQLGLLFGVSIFATSAVLAAFMGGLGLGSFFFGRLVPARVNPVRAYALLELGIGLSALLVGPVLANAAPLYVALARALEDHFLLFNLARALLAILVLLVPTTLMGATVPAIAGFLVKRRAHIGWSTGLLYAANTFGAFVGCIAAGFALVPTLGLSTTVYAAVAVNLGIAGVILLSGLGTGVEERTERAPAASAVASGAVSRDAPTLPIRGAQC